MFSDEAHASWHPALRPNTESEVPQASPPTSSVDQTWPRPAVHDADVPKDMHDKGSSLDGWFPDYATGHAYTDEDAATACRDSQSKPVVNRMSTMSFTRTVPQEVDFDDDDAEWTLPQTNTDPFKFMPPNERTNSFPPILSPSPGASAFPEHPLPASQAEEIIQEIEQEDQGFLGSRAPHYAGGDLHNTAEEAAEARYAEEVPLLPRGEGDHAAGHVDDHVDDHVEDHAEERLKERLEERLEERNPFETTLFAHHTSADDDDFFNQMQTAPVSIEEKQFLGEKARVMVEQATAPEPMPVQEEKSSLGWAEDSADQDDFFREAGTAEPEDMDAKWKEMFGDEDDDGFLPDVGDEKTVDPAAFFGDDDEGFLEDEAPNEVIMDGAAAAAAPTVNGRHMPTLARAGTQPAPQQLGYSVPAAPSPYLPSSTSPYLPAGPSMGPPAAPYGYSAPPPPSPSRPEPAKAQSFITAKGGSGYDLDMDMLKSLKPKKRPSLQSLQRSPVGPVVPANASYARSASYAHAPPRPASVSGMTPPSSSHSAQALPGQRPASYDATYAARPGQPLTPPSQAPVQTPMTDAAGLVAPGPVNPYAPLPGGPPGHATAVPRYPPAPAPAPASAPASAPAQPRYSPALSSRPPSGSYAPATHAHQPRTSSPLAHFETKSDRPKHGGPDGAPPLLERRSTSSLYDSRLQRVPSLPPTREVEEEDSGLFMQPSTPLAGRTPLPPPKRMVTQYSPRTSSQEFAPPPRSQTQSPGALFGNRPVLDTDATPRPSSAHSAASPRRTAAPAMAPLGSRASLGPRARTHSQNLEYMAPTDGRENDGLQRWWGCPLISWGVGGTVVTMFPKEVPRYGMNQTQPALVRSPGEVQIKSVKEIAPLEEGLSRFPGPLRGKSKKKETLAWLTAGIEGLEAGLPANLWSQAQAAHDGKRTMERVLLWKVLRVFVENDGVLEGNPAVESAVRAVLLPSGLGDLGPPGPGPLGPSVAQAPLATTADADSSTLSQIQLHLGEGDREKAAWAAVDKHLWGHAMLIANSASPDLYKRVAQEFVRTEVNVPGQNKQSLAALYAVLSGNHDESVDELVPMHARAGLQLVAKDSASGVSQDALAGLDRWRETLGLILSNRSADDGRAINSLGTLLAEYGRAEAAHVCFLFSRNRTVFGGLHDASSHVVLIGCDHRNQTGHLAREMEPILLSEVYEYGLSLASGAGSAPGPGCPHLAGYKLQHALTLAEYGYRDKALQYCEALTAVINAQTRRSPYHHAVLEAAVDDLASRLKLAPREDSGSWISKPSMTKVSDSVWNRFNKFVAGDEKEDGEKGKGSPDDAAESGPFARVAGATPTISRSPSTTNFGLPVPGYPVTVPAAMAMHGGPPVPTRAASRYAPTVAQLQPTSGNPYEPPLYTPAGPPPPITPGNPLASYQGAGLGLSHSHSPQAAPSPPEQRVVSQTAPPPVNGNAAAPHVDDASRPETHQTEVGPSEDEPSEAPTGYAAPSYQPYGYEPPSYAPMSTAGDGDDDEEEDQPRPKKKGIMYDDDEDDMPPKPREKTKEEKDRENAEMVRRIAEEEAKRDAEAKSAKKGWGFGSWFGGGGAKKDGPVESAKPIRAKLGEANSFVYDPDLKRWVNKNAAAEDTAPRATPPPPRASTPRTAASNPPAAVVAPPTAASFASTPPVAPLLPSGPPSGPPSGRAATPSDGSMPPPPPPRTASAASGPPSRPGTSLSTTSSIDDLLAVGPKKPGARKARKGGRYVDVMANN